MNLAPPLRSGPFRNFVPGVYLNRHFLKKERKKKTIKGAVDSPSFFLRQCSVVTVDIEDTFGCARCPSVRTLLSRSLESKGGRWEVVPCDGYMGSDGRSTAYPCTAAVDQTCSSLGTGSWAEELDASIGCHTRRQAQVKSKRKSCSAAGFSRRTKCLGISTFPTWLATKLISPFGTALLIFLY